MTRPAINRRAASGRLFCFYAASFRFDETEPQAVSDQDKKEKSRTEQEFVRRQGVD